MPPSKNGLLDMTGAQLRAFLAVAEFGGFNAAANELNVSQPTVSKAIRSLEAKVGPLFERAKGRSATLSPVGTLLLEEAVNLLQLLREVERKVALCQARRPLVKIAVGEYLYTFCKDIVAEYSAKNPNINIKLEVAPSHTAAFRALRLGDVDLVIMSQFNKFEGKARIESQAAMYVYQGTGEAGPHSTRLILPIMNEREKREFFAAFGDIGIDERDLESHTSVPHYYAIKSMCIAGQGRALLFEEDARADVAAGRLVQALPGSIVVRRCCHFFGESPLLKDLARAFMEGIHRKAAPAIGSLTIQGA